MFDYIGFGALIRAKRGELGLTQAQLAERCFGNINRKGDISRFEKGNKAPQEDTVQKLCTHLEISEAELVPIRQSRPSATQLEQIPTLSRDELQILASRFGNSNAYVMQDQALRGFLKAKAEEYRALRAEVDGISEGLKRLSNLKSAAQDAIARVDLEEVEEILSRVQEVEKEEAARTAELRADNALLRGKVDQAAALLNDAADSFRIIDPLEPARRKILRYAERLGRHGMRFGGSGLTLSVEMMQQIATANLRQAAPQLWSAAMNAKAIGLQEQGTRTEGPQGADLLAAAVTAYRAALKVYTRADHPVDWAGTQNNLGTALKDQGIRTEGPQGADLLAAAVTALRAALEVRTRADHPVQWAATQNNLGNGLKDQGIRAEGPQGADLLAAAVTAYRSALEVYTRADHPVDWSVTQNNLAIALRNQGIRTEGPQGADLLAAAVTAYRAALKVRTRADHPVDWAMTQNNLGNTLGDQGIRTVGPQGTELLVQAVAAYRASLEVRTRAEHPVQWAATQDNIAITFLQRAAHGTTADPRPDLTEALSAVTAALEVFDPIHMSYNHAKATRLRDRIQTALDTLP